MVPPDVCDETFAALVEGADALSLKNRAMDEAPIGITIADMTHDVEPVVYANAGFERITGYPQADILGRNCRFLQGAETDDESVATIRAAIEAGDPVQVELLNYRKDGTSFWNEVTLAPISRDAGEVEYYVGFQQDVTQRKEHALRLEQQRDDLALLNQLIRHDIRNDLQLVLGSIDLLQDRVDDPDLRHVETALESVQHAVELTETVGEMADVMGQTERQELSVALLECLWPPLEECRSAHPDATIRVDETLPDVTVQADELLESVFDNLLTNAIQHTDTERPAITISVTADDEYAIVRIADDGPGVPDDLKETVFGRGEKGPESKGTGIGLYLCDTLVDDYGGEMWIEDNDPEGAVFVVKLLLDG